MAVGTLSPLDSPVWYRVAELVPRLRDHVRVHRHQYRGRRWYVLQDVASGRHHRLDEAAFWVVSLMDGRRNLQSVWSIVDGDETREAPTQDQVIQLLGTLHAADVLQCDVTPDTEELFARQRKYRGQKALGALRSPFFVRIPLLDPDKWLKRVAPRCGAVFTAAGLIAWATLVFVAAVLALLHMDAITADARAQLFTPYNLLLLWLTYPVVKAIHEFGHAVAVRHWGGEVHDVGIMLLVFMPVPYVDASAANAFASKWARVAVSGAGIAVELALASLALLVWLTVEPGLVRTLALNVMTIGGVSTLLFNGNPLLRFDGYYVLADALEIPNLATRANRYWGYLLRRYALGIATAGSPARAPGERRWFVGYGLAAFVYRLIILALIILFVADVSLTLAIVLGAWAIAGQMVLPALQRIAAMHTDPQVRERRGRALLVAAAAAGLAALVIFVPVPHRTLSEGVVWLGENAHVRTGTDCFVERLLVPPGTRVQAGAALVVCTDPLLQYRLRVVEARLAELRARHQAAIQEDRARAQIVADRIAAVENERDDARAAADRLVVRSATDGVFVLPTPEDLPGRFLAQGELVGYVLDAARLDLRVAIAQSDIGLVRSQTTGVAVKLVEQPQRSFAANIQRASTAASSYLPAAALGTRGGGPLPTDRTDDTGLRLLEPAFVLALELAEPAPPRLPGARVYVRFDHGNTALALQWYRSARQMLLRRLAV